MLDYKIKFSYTFVRDFDNCPEQTRVVHIAKQFKKTFTPQLTKGVNHHDLIEKRIKDKQPLPPELALAEAVVQSFERRGKVEGEAMLGVDHMWRPVSFWDAWFRGKFDISVRDHETRTAAIGDWKTGNPRETPVQLEIGAHLLMQNDPLIDTVLGVNVWLKVDKLGTPYTFKRGDGATARLTKKLRDIEVLDAKVEWEKRTGPLCAYCPVKTCESYRGG